MSFDFILLGTSILLILSILSSKASGRLGVPALLLFLLLGMLAGSEGIGGIDFNDAYVAQSLGVVALIFILFSGGFDTAWREVRPVLPHGLVLASLGVFLTALLVGVLATAVTDLSWYEGMLLGAIVSSTDAAAVFAVLRSRGVSLRGNLKPLLELESGSNDPMAIFLTTAMVGLLTGTNESLLSLVWLFFQQMIFGGLLGYAAGRAIVYIINRMQLGYDGLYPVLSIGLVLLTYSATTLLSGNGFLAVYVAGLVMGNTNVIHQRSLMRFHDGLAWLMQIVMFLTLGLLVFPSQVLAVAGTGLLVSAFLIFVARPVSVFLLLAPFQMNLRKTALVGWVGLRGAVPIVLATFPLLAGVTNAELIFNLVFFIVITSVLVQGSTIPIVAHWLRVDAPLRRRRRSPLEFDPVEGIEGELTEIELPKDAPAAGKRLVELGLPPGALLVLVGRDDRFFVPNGSTTLEGGDILFFLSDTEALAKVIQLVNTPQAA